MHQVALSSIRVSTSHSRKARPINYLGLEMAIDDGVGRNESASVMVFFGKAKPKAETELSEL